MSIGRFPRVILAFIAVLLLFSVVFISMRFFVTQRTTLADRRNALMIASHRIWDIVPDDMQNGFYSETEIAGNSDYLVEISLSTVSDNVREIRVSVFSPSGEKVELVRGVYGNNEKEFQIDYDRTTD